MLMKCACPDCGLVFDPSAAKPEVTLERMEAANKTWCELRGLPVTPLGHEARYWSSFFKAGYNERQFDEVFRYVRSQRNMGKRPDGALRLSNLIDVERFAEDLALARANWKQRPPESKTEQPTTAGEFYKLNPHLLPKD